MSPTRALIVEDDPLFASYLVALLQRYACHGYVYQTARVGSLHEAEVALNTSNYDVVLVDLYLPDSQHTRAVELIQRLAPQVPIVAMTGRSDLAERCLEAGAQEFVPKGHAEFGYHVETALRCAIVRHRVRSAFQPLHESLQRIETSLEKLPTVAGKPHS